MTVDENTLARLACPRCRGPLSPGERRLACAACAANYEVRDGVPDLLPWSGGDPGPQWDAWRRRLGRLEEWRRATWDGSAAGHARQQVADGLAAAFFRFARVPESGAVLDIGCGSGELRRHIPRRPYVGLDPLAAGPAPADDAVIVRGVGERLPFAGAAFTTVLICETLDHALDPPALIAEARRVLRPGGVIAVMQNVRLAIPPPPLTRRLRVAAGRLKARLAGRRRIEDAETKMHVLGQDDLASMLHAAFVVESGITEGAVMFLRALAQDPAGPRIPKRPV